MRNVYVLPGVPEIFRQKFDAIRERFRDDPIHLKNVFVRIGEGTLAAHLNELLRHYPRCCSARTRVLQSEYRVKSPSSRATRPTWRRRWPCSSRDCLPTPSSKIT